MNRTQANLIKNKLSKALYLIREAFGDIQTIEMAENEPITTGKAYKVKVKYNPKEYAQTGGNRSTDSERIARMAPR